MSIEMSELHHRGITGGNQYLIDFMRTYDPTTYYSDNQKLIRLAPSELASAFAAGFEVGLKQPVTEAEIEAAVMAFRDHCECIILDDGWTVNCTCDFNIVSDSSEASLAEWEKHVAEVMLSAARKQVSDEPAD